MCYQFTTKINKNNNNNKIKNKTEMENGPFHYN